MQLTKENLLTVLKTVSYPEKEDIVSLNMVNDLKIEGKKVNFSLLFSSAEDPNIIPLKKACVKQLENSFSEIEIKGNISIKVQGKSTPKSEEKMLSGVKNIIAVSSGKGGVGKSTVAVNLAVSFARNGYKVGLLDADIFGPSVPKMLGVEGEQIEVKTLDGNNRIVPCEKYGIKMLSIGFFVGPEQATIWRGPMAGNALKQLIQDGDWGELDYLFIDLPPGTSDIHLTMVQVVTVTGAVIVSTPQQVALADAIKGLDMFGNNGVNVPIIGLIENMAWFTPRELPDNKYYIFGKNGCKELAQQYNIPFLGEIPLVQEICETGDTGKPLALDTNNIESSFFDTIMDNIIAQLKK